MSKIVWYYLSSPNKVKRALCRDVADYIRFVLIESVKLHKESKHKIHLETIFTAMLRLMELEMDNIVKIPQEDETEATNIYQTPENLEGE